MPPLPEVHVGSADSEAPDWRAQENVADSDGADDDAELAETPEDVVRLLGFDPADL